MNVTQTTQQLNLNLIRKKHVNRTLQTNIQKNNILNNFCETSKADALTNGLVFVFPH